LTYTIQNPVISGFAPDPSILRVGTDYYIATSTFQWNPGIQIFHSTDLANWRLLTHVLTKSEFDLRGTNTPAGIWAPHLSFDEQTGRYWMALSKMNNMTGRMFDADNYAMWSKSITGPWSDPIYLNSIGFDPSLFHDKDGKHYVVTLEWETREGYEHPGAIVLDQFDPDKQCLIGESTRISRGGTDRGCLEAPHLYWHDGWYYLMTAEGGTGYGHGVVMQRSRSITGPYESDPMNPIVTSTPYPYFRRGDPDAARSDLYNPLAPLQKADHGSIVETPNHEWYLAHLCARPLPGTLKSTLGRETAIQKMKWTSDGWFRMADGTTLAKDTTPGISGMMPQSEMTERGLNETFTQSTLSPLLMTPYCQQNKTWLDLSQSGKLRMKGRESFFSQRDVSILAARVDAFQLTAETRMAFQPRHFSQAAGLLVYYDNANWLFARCTYDEQHDQSVLDIVQAIRGEKTELMRQKIPVTGTKIELKVRLDGAQAQFYYRNQADTTWLTLGTVQDIDYLSDEVVDGFTGLMVGIGAWDAYRRDSVATFDYLTLVDD
jgi:xylan 1,4-beta-xylosidase